MAEVAETKSGAAPPPPSVERSETKPTPPPRAKSIQTKKAEQAVKKESSRKKKNAGLEGTIFTWEDWDEGGCYGDMEFDGIALVAPLKGLDEGAEIVGASWMPSRRKVAFVLKGGGMVCYSMHLTLERM